MKTIIHTAYFNYIDGIEIAEDIARNCSHSGPCDDDVERARQLPEVQAELAKIKPEQLRKELAEYGAWTDQELADHSANLDRILWIAAGQIMDELYEQSKSEEV